MLERLTAKITSKLDHVLNSQGHIFALSRDVFERNLYLSGQIAARQLKTINKIDTLADVEFRVHSQWGEDGIIEWLVQKLPGISRTFVEFGVENFGEANTRFLLRNRGWKGLIMDGTAANMQHVQAETLYWMHDLLAVEAFVTAENINELITQNGFAGELGILSVDIDGNDYWVMKAIDCVKPAILILEFNGVFGDVHEITTPYEPSFERLKAHHSGQYFGASLEAMKSLAKEKGFTFVGTNSNGVNAFFVRNDLAKPIVSSIGTIKSWPARHRDSRDGNGVLTFERGENKAALIEGLPVHNIANGEVQSIASLGPLYSEEWANEL